MILYLQSFSDVSSQVFQYHERPTAHGTTYGPLSYYTEPNLKGTDFGRRIHDHLLGDIEGAVIGLGRLVQVGGPNVHKRTSSLLLSNCPTGSQLSVPKKQGDGLEV